ncbi:hypothetical protein BC351_01275 [Paenibacillus ferrarius]|uniref:Uncharacterized protein n=1 Tax=Paenibacillus ferrarius TaxID=1469647 RepID=A0A1V4HSU5_9BACL|nr:hypothetical protein BC351_01275 [Paenibacillus ferrarius]
MRSQLNIYSSDSGVIQAFYEYEDTYRDFKIAKVVFPHDNDIRTRYDELCGKVTYKRIEDLNIGVH